MTYLSDLITWGIENVLGLNAVSGAGQVIHFFIYASIEIFTMMTLIIMFIGLLRSYIDPQKIKKLLGRVGKFNAHVLASLLGAVTPFCSCSSVPVFIGFIESGIPLGATFSFLITSPIVNEAAMAMLWVTFGWQVALAYTVTGILIGIIGGLLIEALHLEHLVEDYVRIQSKDLETMVFGSHKDRLLFAVNEAKAIIKKVWIYVVAGILIGAFIHGWTPSGVLMAYAGPDNPLAVIVGVLIGVPVYASNVMIVPIVKSLIGKGMGVGTALAFMMAAAALSLPEMIMLRKVLKAKLVRVFVLITSVSIILVGYLFNFMLSGLV